jgi:antitoxin StbD
LRDAGEKPVAVLNHNRPAFYMVTPKLFEAMIEEMADRDLAELVRQRLLRKELAVEVDIDQL